ncbi:DnaJ (Hsp40), sub C, member 17 [Friedmanniomyces endolithicus]|uniref:DnaJ (Hsp40), sub C, member 17 n=1 Tax=Friedmanniomyces endolithicus TaxID=329885 RepID=A0AAN6FLT5_9PEZI|nr:DnaJ (Hsp40), sub C, member 17 [Friedmanniomyces endolithicus]KAK0293441.1 DnaJ (Hsp40), sub C, member 17 [Friedmanniomyces endolithicus]KAK0318983.1 DnaJ (Hsp40), sub C, member 17 [Friedmanniomyces endolithicus]KAK0997417.1 DnaJ (Hsp40), sub C, member 17 [Friedmanniomyces endolithicus]
MSSTSDIKNLRAQVANDLNIYKAEKARFYRLQGLEPEEVTEADRMSIINWSRASIRDYSFPVEQLEDLVDPTVEQKEVMQLLNRLIMLGDEIGEITSSFIERYETKFGKSRDNPASPLPATSKPTSNQPFTAPIPAATPAQQMQQPVTPRSASPEPEVETHREAAFDPTSNAPGIPQTASPLLDAHHSEPVTPTTAPVRDEAAHSDETDDEESDDEEVCGEKSVSGGELINLKDPKGVYAMLGVAPSASMPEVQKAIRKMLVASHPDRNPDNPDAASDFAEFMSLCEETVKTEEKRRAYDNITTADELEQLTKRVRTLTMSKYSEE